MIAHQLEVIPTSIQMLQQTFKPLPVEVICTCKKSMPLILQPPHISAMNPSTEISAHRAIQDASATPTSSDHTSSDGTLPANVQPTTTPSNCIIFIQNNRIAEGGTINIFSSHCTSSSELFTCPGPQENSNSKQAVTKLK
ncbi:hypothetical protein K503DRAFT_473218 [Rhizopogon vinicolor AM-OR11-026]|uniref:Uncharacterized protein n=1 Tax=Rhizopogon vinicolor AM-OR11-026 TaxID=1314800 RepID=A0A1B7MN89_9AGAM|nr:hypothetical protein K503DRAFT_473218 [Rhizopogon vinicolor AM-OR11-026]